MRIKTIITVIVTLIPCLLSSICFAGSPIKKATGREHYVKEAISNMTLKEMVGQLIMIGSDSDISAAYIEKIMNEIDSNKVGGVCFFKGESKNVPILIGKYNSISKIPLMVSIDGEWGTAMRLTDIESFPRALTLGVLSERNYNLVYEMGRLIARQCKSLGIHINFAPDIDINLTASNPVINTRAFGENKYKVALLGEQYIKGMQDEGIMAVIKHFPGHGDTDVDSHKSLPTINHSKDFIDSVDLFPFVYNIESGVWGVMIAHLNVPALNQKYNYPASINPNIINEYLIKKLNFKGLVFTDAMNMKGLTNDYPDGQAQVLALKAGVDVLLMPNDTKLAIEAILKAVEDGTLSKEFIKEKCKKVLRWKYDMGIISQKNNTKKQKETAKTLNPLVHDLNQRIANQTMTLLKNENGILPLKLKEQSSIAIINVEDEPFTTFDEVIAEKYTTKRYFIDKKATSEQIDSILTLAEQEDLIITAIAGGMNQTKKVNYGLNERKIEVISKIQAKERQNILVLFANPYCLESLDSLDKYNALVMACQNLKEFHISAANAILGNIEFNGRIPVSASKKYGVFSGITKAAKQKKKSYKQVEEAGMQSECFEKIDSIIDEGIKQKAYPGAQVLIAKDGKIIYERNVGYQTYDSQEAITDSSVYDLASLTKVLATTIAVMKLYEEDKFSLDDKLSKYLPYLKKTNKSKITIREVLAHTAGLKAFIPIWKNSLNAAKEQTDLYSNNKYGNKDYLQVCDSLFIQKAYKKEIRKIIADSPLNSKPKYLYSDLGFITLGDLIEEVSGQSLDSYLEETFFKPMRLHNTAYNPNSKSLNPDNIVPTIEAIDFRKSKIKGFVHDETAALNGGVAGHAGLFSNAREVFAICQMLLNEGEYNGKQYLKPETIKTFNHRYYAKQQNRRGLGFDKPLISSPSSHCSKYCSQESFGHSGFTGTYFWVEPQNNTIFIFLSNRVYPDAKVNKLAQMNIRTDIQDLIYESLKK